MAKLTKRIIDAAEARDKDYVIWDDELPGFGLRVFTSGKRSYLIQYRSGGRSRRYTIGQHGVWTPELARKEAKVQLGRIAQGDNPAEERQLDHKAVTVKELCELYLNDLKAGLILGKGGRPKKPTTIVTDTGRIHRHIVPLIGTRRVKDLVKADINKVLKDIMAGKTRVSVKTKKLRGKAVVRGGVGTATRTVGLLGGILTYAVEAGIIETNPAHGIRKPKDNVRNRRLSEAEYRTLGRILRTAAEDERYQMTTDIIRQIALTGCRRSEMIKLRWIEADMEASCLRLIDSKEGASTRPIGLPVVEYLESRWTAKAGTYVFPGQGDDNAFGSFPNHWETIFRNTSLADITPHVLASQAYRTILGSLRLLSRPLSATRKDRLRANISILSTRRSSWLPIRSRAISRACSTVWSSSRPPTPLIATPGRLRLRDSFAKPSAGRWRKRRKSGASPPKTAGPGVPPVTLHDGRRGLPTTVHGDVR
jgi:integrase